MEFCKDHQLRNLRRDSIKLSANRDMMDSIFRDRALRWIQAARNAFQPEKRQACQLDLFTVLSKLFQHALDTSEALILLNRSQSCIAISSDYLCV